MKNTSRQLNGWIESLKDSKIKGLKYLTGKEREQIAHEKEFEEFDAQMAKFRRQHLEMLEKRQQDTASAHAAEELEDDLLAAGVRYSGG